MIYAALVLAAVTAAAAAKPHGHAHRHVAAAKRANTAVYVPGPVETVVVYELNGQLISEDDVRNGIANGTFTWGDDGVLSSSIVVAPTPAPTVEVQSDKNSQVTEQPGPSSVDESASKPTEQSDSSTSSAPDLSANSPVDDDGNCADCDKEFPNGKLDCTQFPVGYGAIPVGNEGLGGWAGVQAPANGLANDLSKRGELYHDIMTVPTGSCPDGHCCSPGRFCSYSCANPYLKMSWPKMQGASKQSVGGLYCNKHGKLEMGDGSISKSLCGRGSTRVKVKVQSKLSKPVSICRTDYPGTEAETLPLTINPGETKELANPDQSSYYNWDNKPTSAQYYVNNQGVEEKQACTWGDGSSNVGNWAPVNIGTSFVSKPDLGPAMGYTSVFQNKPTNPDGKLNFAIHFDGDGVSDACSYKNGQYSSAKLGVMPDGCTSGVADGSTITLVFTDN